MRRHDNRGAQSALEPQQAAGRAGIVLAVRRVDMASMVRKLGRATQGVRRAWGGVLLGVTAVLLCIPQTGCGDLMCGGTCEHFLPVTCRDFSVDKCPEGCSAYDRCACKSDNCSDATAYACQNSRSAETCAAHAECDWSKRCSEADPDPCVDVHQADACAAIAHCKWHQECD